MRVTKSFKTTIYNIFLINLLEYLGYYIRDASIDNKKISIEINVSYKLAIIVSYDYQDETYAEIQDVVQMLIEQ